MQLFIDSSSLLKTVVSLENGGQTTLTTESERTVRSQILIKSIMDLIKQAKVNLADLDEIKVITGPGSFTGIRVGVSVANAFAYSLGIMVNQKTVENALKYE
jgi:tRNA threonylcarbamoyladenosine biosynthesis protein TsaB